MTLYLLIWLNTAYTCPWGLGYSPQFVKEVTCSRSQKFEYAVYADKGVLLKHARELGPNSLATVVELRGSRSRTLPIQWLPGIGG